MGFEEEYQSFLSFHMQARKGDNLTPGDIIKLLNLSNKTARKILKELVQKRMLCPASGKQRIGSYRLDESVKNPLFLP